ncbi:MAG: ribD [Hydrocarboniphaga sp.]|uniref:bifunctional diaminohydroxyphosphoribosylaminopyrimidine deaminase/5-amino-6-(5-phosphoribosylamino)uracil reductase RibD n=1 Tax=Hydrocarboniphaga sp. TaxID=2033016 RepID=UPI002615ABD3|nr:bifunctional diaminohydroxyphosphoribosylaminopyrimidine deaminase/5-amino-6-(5-phosphoribosylamino)uracil reductase RibD [Hydrocarboniphaga sp.]MDB5968597.1 ribD [Hydrocarboniphaga sp.]
MARALHLAERGRLSTFPNPRVGCVIVRGGEIVGEGWHERAGEPHAEVYALGMAGERARGADIYVTLEPCSHHGRTPPCSDAVITAGPARVVVAMRDPNPLVAGRGIETLQAAGIIVETGLMEAAARQLNRGFVSRMERGRPFVTLKLGASLDGRTATASGESQWITGADARADVHRLREEAGAVLTSSATVLADDPQLTVRHFSPSPASGGGPGWGRDGSAAPARPHPGLPPLAGEGDKPSRQPDRIVLDPQARVSPEARVWAPGARRIWLVGKEPVQRPDDVEVILLPLTSIHTVDLDAALKALAAAGINELMIECGATLAGSLLEAKLVDELLIYLAPSLLGSEARGLANLSVSQLDQRIRLRYTDVRRVGADLKIIAAIQEI